MRVLLAMRDGEKRERLKLLLESERSDCSVFLTGDGKAALAQILVLSPDVLYLDQILPVLDGQAVLQALKSAGLSCPPKVILLTVSACGELSSIDTLTDLNLPAASDITALQRAADLVQDVPQGALAALGRGLRLQLIQAHFDALGMPEKLKGRMYLSYLLDLAIPSPWLIDALTTKLYPWAARQYKTTPQALERCIRHAIEATWSRGDMTALERLFGLSIDPDRGKPTNREFLAMSAQHLRLGYGHHQQMSMAHVEKQS